MPPLPPPQPPSTSSCPLSSTRTPSLTASLLFSTARKARGSPSAADVSASRSCRSLTMWSPCFTTPSLGGGAAEREHGRSKAKRTTRHVACRRVCMTHRGFFVCVVLVRVRRQPWGKKPLIDFARRAGNPAGRSDVSHGQPRGRASQNPKKKKNSCSHGRTPPALPPDKLIPGHLHLSLDHFSARVLRTPMNRNSGK